MTKYILLFALGFLVSCQTKHKKESIQPKVTDITELVYASVIVKPELSYFPQPTRTGIIQEIFVQEGEKIEIGQLLVRISTSADINNRLTNAEINLNEAKENYLGKNNMLLNIELELKSLKDQLTLDSLKYYRQKKLWEQNIGKKMDLEQYELAYKVTQKKYEILKQKKAQTLNELESQYKKAISQEKSERTQLDDFILRSTISGMVYNINKKEGELISSQERFAEIGSADNFVVEMDIDEEDITKISIGDTVAITLNAYADEVFIALVSKVFPKKDEITQTFRVESIFINQPPKLYNGLSGEANIMVNKISKTIVIPSEYLMEGNKVVTNKGIQSVQTGVKNMKFVEIISGIDTSTILLKPKE
jgi:HlyD family secretion protein